MLSAIPPAPQNRSIVNNSSRRFAVKFQREVGAVAGRSEIIDGFAKSVLFVHTVLMRSPLMQLHVRRVHRIAEPFHIDEEIGEVAFQAVGEHLVDAAVA